MATTDTHADGSSTDELYPDVLAEMSGGAVVPLNHKPVRQSPWAVFRQMSILVKFSTL